MTTGSGAEEMRVHADGVILTVSGRLTMNDLPSLQARLAQALASCRPPRLVVDVGELESIDSFCLSALMGAERQARESGGGVVIAGATDLLRAALVRRGLDKVFTFRPGPAVD
ncbi:STAS domain-containing protein [Nonomuraea sp. NN258]|uniref:STAS domain-containing protein n=1 Tax=Nonomuraea antri TaxID=2730852 RepID=UPI001569602E|nr:STAS domain-containing protein [Nonomuraea antri]NRQ36954.1 STAS domain-containing protein [Nonomuraea antri]